MTMYERLAAELITAVGAVLGDGERGDVAELMSAGEPEVAVLIALEGAVNNNVPIAVRLVEDLQAQYEDLDEENDNSVDVVALLDRVNIMPAT